MAKVVMFSADWCDSCVSLKEKYRRAGIAFYVVDVESQSGSQLADGLGVGTLPAVFVETGERYVRVRGAERVGAVKDALARHG